MKIKESKEFERDKKSLKSRGKNQKKESKMKIKESKKSDGERRVLRIVGATTKPGELHFLVKVSGEEDIPDNSCVFGQF